MFLEELIERRLLVNMGKGGVGRSSISAALACYAAERGKRVLVCEVNTKERMSHLLGGNKPETFTEIEQIWQPRDNIWTVNIEPWTAMKEYVQQVLKMRLIYNIVFENPLMRYFLRAIPGLQDLVFIGKVWYHTTEKRRDGSPRFDLVIVDAPATGHGIAMLRIPFVVTNTVPVGPMYKAAQQIKDLLTDSKKTSINLITLPEEMPVNETIELHQTVKEKLKLPLGGLFLNQWPKGAYSNQNKSSFEKFLKAGIQDEKGWPLFTAAQAADTIVSKAERHFNRLQEALSLPICKIPRLPVEELQDGFSLIQELTKKLD